MKPLHLALVFALLLPGSLAFAQSKIELRPNDTMHDVLTQQAGKPVELRMKSGEKIAGKLEKVSNKMVHISQLQDADFFDAAIAIDSIAAVVVRVRSN